MAISHIATAVRAVAGSSASVTHGFTLQDGDFLAAYINRNDSIAITNDAGGWTEELQQTPATGETNSHATYTKKITDAASEPASYAWTLNGTDDYQLIIYQFRSDTGANIIIDSPAVAAKDTSSVHDLECNAVVGRTAAAGAVSVVFGGKDRDVNAADWIAVSGGFEGIAGDGRYRATGGAYKIHATEETFASEIVFTSSAAVGSDTTYSMHFSFKEEAGGGTTPVNNGFQILWNAEQNISNGMTVNWNTLNPVSGSSSFLWNLLENVTAQTQVNWDLLSNVFSSTTLEWSLVQSVQQSVSLEWNIFNAVANSTQIDWDVLNTVMSTREVRWNIFNQVINGVQVDWNVLATLSNVVSSVEMNWNLLEAVTNAASINWDVLNEVSNGTELRFNILNQISQNLGLQWDLVATVGNTVEVNWDVEQAAGKVSNSLDLSWNVLAVVQAQVEAHWDILQSVGVSTNLSWNIAEAVQNAIQANWSILEGVENGLSVTWNSIALVNGNVQLNWSVQTEQIRLPIHQMIIQDENRIMTVSNVDHIMKIH